MHWCTRPICIAFLALIYCEFLGDFQQLSYCKWPSSSTSKVSNGKEEQLRAMIIADPHLLGPIRGHWLDKLYREWHMHRSFQAAMRLFAPEIVFVLGDLFDEGDFVNNRQFEHYVQRFHRLFSTPAGVPIISAAGNHDIGFHYKMDRYFVERFSKHFNNTGVAMYTIKGSHFVIINSMAMLNDGCGFCNAALKDLNRISAQLKCLQNDDKCLDVETLRKHHSYSRPILMQHFPTYRKSDAVCKEHDAPKIELFRKNWEVLSKESTDLIGKLLSPRVAFAGHSHHFCLNINRFGIEEYTVASFSWRNKIEPSFLLATFSTTSYDVSKCEMLPQQHVYSIYLAGITLILASTIYGECRKLWHKKIKENKHSC